MLNNYDIIIVGCGLSGIVIAERFSLLQNKKILIIDKRNHIGGNCYDYYDKKTNILMNKYGAHLFHTNDEEVFSYINQFCKWEKWEHKVLGLIDDKHLPIPPNITTVNKLFNLDIKSEEEMDEWLSENQVKYDNITNGEEMAKSRVGEVLYEKIFKHYTYKQWKKYPDELAPEVLARIPVRNSFDDRYFSDKYQVLPRKGYTAFFQSILDKHKDNIDVKLNFDFFDIKDKITKNQLVIYTGPIDAYFADKGLPKLEYRSIDFHIERQMNTKFYQPYSVVNYPSDDTPYTRCVEYKHFLNQKSDHTVYVKETTTDKGEPYYPVLNDKNKELYKKYQKMAKEEGENIHFLGRLASYKYFNMDQAIKNSLDYYKEHFAEQKLPKNIFLLWLQGWDNAPWLQRQVRKSWEINNPDWNIILLDESNLRNYINDIDYIYDESKNIQYQAKSDIIRLSVLKNIGGVWADSTMLCMQPLDNWVHEKVEPAGMWMYRGGGGGMPGEIGPASWFIVSKSGNYILTEWKKECDNYWITNPIVNHSENYFWMDILFKKLYNSNSNFKELWSLAPNINCGYKGSSHTLANFGMDGNDNELKEMFKISPPYALKFWNYWHDLFDGDYNSEKCKESNGGYAITLSTQLQNNLIETENEKNIFTIWTTNNIQFNPDVIACFKSHAMFNPDKIIYILSNTIDIDYFNDHSNIKIIRYDLESLCEKIGVKFKLDYLKNLDKIKTCKFWYSHETDLLRYLFIYLYGGIYLDSDILLFKNIDYHLVKNTISYESDKNSSHQPIASAYFSFEKRHNFMLRCLDRFWRVWNPIEWCCVGPFLINDIYKEYYIGCKNILISSDLFFPINWNEIIPYIHDEKSYTLEMKEKVVNIKKYCIGLHLWNSRLKKHLFNEINKELLISSKSFIFNSMKKCGFEKKNKKKKLIFDSNHTLFRSHPFNSNLYQIFNDASKYYYISNNKIYLYRQDGSNDDYISNVNLSFDFEIVISRYNESVSWSDIYSGYRYIYNKGPTIIDANLHHGDISLDGDVVEADIHGDRYRKLENKGRESDTMLNYIIENYDNIPDYVAFSQGGIDNHGWNRPKDWGPTMFLNMLFEAFRNGGYSNHLVFNRHDNPEWSLKLDYKQILSYDNKVYDNNISFIDFLKKIGIYDSFHHDEKNYQIKIYPSSFMIISKENILSRSKSYYEDIIKYCNYHLNPIEGHYFERSWAYIFNTHKPIYINNQIIKIYCNKRKRVWFKDVNKCTNLIENPNTYIIYTKNGEQKILPGVDYVGPDLLDKPCSDLEQAKNETYTGDTEFYFYIRGHIRNSFNNNRLKNFLQMLKLHFPNIKFILQTWKRQECKNNESWKKINENNSIITKQIIENYFEDKNITEHCLIIDDDSIELIGSTNGTIGIGPCPKQGWKNMWYGIYKGLENLDKSSKNIIVSFRYDYFDIKESYGISEKKIIQFIRNNLNKKKIQFLKNKLIGTDNLYMGTYNKIKVLIEKFHFKLDDILNLNKKIFHQEFLVNIIAETI